MPVTIRQERGGVALLSPCSGRGTSTVTRADSSLLALTVTATEER